MSDTWRLDRRRGFHRIVLDAEAVETARLRHRERAEMLWDTFEVDPENDRRADGYIGEAGFELWLAKHGLAHERHGGADDLPDFVVKDQRLAIKTSTLDKRNVCAAERHLQDDAEWIVGCAIDTASGLFEVRGAVTAADFREYGVRRKLGAAPAFFLLPTGHERLLPPQTLIAALVNLRPALRLVTA